MDKFQCKSSNILNKPLKEKQRGKEAKKVREAQKKARKASSQEQLRDVRFSYCSYCGKAFSESGYLVKHILRRHPNELLEIHEQFVNSNTRQRDIDTSTQPKVLSAGVEKDIIDIKETLNDFKLRVLEKLHDGSNEIDTHSKPNKDLTRKGHRMSKSQGEEFRRFCVELQELRLQCQNSERTILNLEEKHKRSLEAIKREITSNEENREQNNTNIQRMVRNILSAQKKEITHIREEVAKQLTSFRQVVMADFQKQCLEEWDSKLSNLASQHVSDVEKLQSLIQVKVARLEKAQNEKSIEKMFEQHLQSYLNKIEKNPKRKHDVSRTSLNDTDAKFQHSQNSTSLVSSRNFNDIPRSCHSKHKTPKLHVIPKKQKLGDSGKCQGRLSPNQQQRIGDNSPNCQKLTSFPKQYSSTPQKPKLQKPLFITKRVRAALRSNPYMLDQLQEELCVALESKMQEFGFEPGQKSLSNAEFEAKKVLVYNDMNHLGVKGDFFALRSKIDDLVTKKVKSYLLQNKGAKRIHFADPEFAVESLAMSSILAEQDSGEQKKAGPCESSGFIVSDSMPSKLPGSKEVPQSVPSESSLEDKEILIKKAQYPVTELPINLPNFDRMKLFENGLTSKIRVESSSSDSSETSSSSLQAIVVRESPGDNIAAVSSSGNKDKGSSQSSFIRRELKFEQGDAESTVSQGFHLSKKPTTLNAKEEEVDELDNKSSLESLNDWDSDEDDDKLDVIHI